jgi:hypothetical protein
MAPGSLLIKLPQLVAKFTKFAAITHSLLVGAKTWSSARSRTVRGRERGSYELKYAEQAATASRAHGFPYAVGKSGAAYFALANPAVPGRIGRHEFLSTVPPRERREKRSVLFASWIVC